MFLIIALDAALPNNNQEKRYKNFLYKNYRAV